MSRQNGGLEVDTRQFALWSTPDRHHSTSTSSFAHQSMSGGTGAFWRAGASSTPLTALGESLKSAAASNANSLVLYAKAAAKSNPDVARLVSNYETWENNLKAEATRRLGTFQPPASLLYKGGLLSEDWALLKRVQHSAGPLTLSGTMKRSASETDIEQASTSGFPHGPWKSSAASSKPSWVNASFSQGPNDASASPEGNDYRGNAELDDLHSHITMRPSMAGQAPRLVFPIRTAPSLLPEGRLGMTSSSSEGNLAGELMTARNLEAVAQSILNHSRMAIQSAQQSIQQTAANCQQNLQSLGNVLQANSSLTGSRALVPWQVPLQDASQQSPFISVDGSTALAIVTSAEAGGPGDTPSLSGALVPWAVFPRYLRAKEAESAGAMVPYGVSDSSEERLEAAAAQEWYAPFERYMESLDAMRLLRPQGYKSLREPGRQVAIVTTAALPWLTGTSVNPLLRAAYLANDASRKVTLVLPWLSKVDQERIFPNHVTFETPEDQEEFVREWARKRTGLDCNFKISFYPGRYAAEKGSILPVGDITSCIPDHEADVAVLEEPEHLNWYHHGRRWTDKFKHVVGVMHTNYLDYARREEGGPVKEAILKHINAWMCRIYCHKVIKLSDAVQPLPREQTMFVHGVSPAFLQVGKDKACAPQEQRWASEAHQTSSIYFLGKVLWAKGYTELLDRLNEHASKTGERIPVDVYGSGPDMDSVQEEAARRHLPLNFNGARDHADASLRNYKVFINPSLSDVVATTTAEALAMGKYVVCADHPSNKFFEQFPNCLIYRTPEEFSSQVQRALASEPQPLSTQQLHSLTWEAATDRFLDIAELQTAPNPLEAAVDNVLAAAHWAVTGSEKMRVATGAGANTRDMPARITDYVPTMDDVGGLFDDRSRARRIYAGDKASKK